MRILREGKYFATGDDLLLISEVAGEPLEMFDFHPDDYREKKLKEVREACERELHAIKASYPESEVQSWYKQEIEAREYISNPQANIPLITRLANTRNIAIPELASRIIQKADAYTEAMGMLLGKRQALEDALWVATDWKDMAPINWDA